MGLVSIDFVRVELKVGKDGIGMVYHVSPASVHTLKIYVFQLF